MKPKISACATAQRHVLVCKWHLTDLPILHNQSAWRGRPEIIRTF